MRGPFKEGDIVGVDHQGREFLAMIDSPDHHTKSTQLKVQPLIKNITYYYIDKRDVQTVWPLKRGKMPVVKASGGIVYG